MTLTKKAAPVNLDALADETAGVVVLFGREHAVKQLDGAGYQVAIQLQSGEIDILEQYKLAARLVPTLTEEEVGKLTAQQVGAIVTIADGKIRQVEAMLAEQAKETADPNGAGPAGESPPA